MISFHLSLVLYTLFLQAVAFLALLKYLDGDAGPHLLVAPASLLENWQRELKKWCPAFRVELYHGPERATLNRKLNHLSKNKGPAPFNVMLTCYSLFERQRSVCAWRHLILEWIALCTFTNLSSC